MASSSSSSTLTALRDPPTTWDAVVSHERSLVLPSFTSLDAYTLGALLRSRIPEWLPSSPPAIVHICLANSGNVLYHAVTEPREGRKPGQGVLPDNDTWVQRKKQLVLRWGCSSYAMHCKMKGDEQAFADKFMLSGDKRGEVSRMNCDALLSCTP